MNDPNGLCYFKGEYHVFFQYSPEDVQGGLKHWGHYKSKDLLHWEDMGIFLYPDKEWKRSGAYSGSALEKDGTLYIFYTGNVKEEGDFDRILTGRQHNTVLASTRDGIHVEEDRVLMRNGDYPAHLSLHVRDPKVFAHEGRYYMVQGARSKDAKGEVEVFESENLYDWKHINSIRTDYPFGYMWECPDLFTLGGDWFLLLSPQGVERQKYAFQNRYSCGYFKLEGDFRGEYRLGEYRELDTGFDYYAPQTFVKDDRRLVLGWHGMPEAEYSAPTAQLGWQHCMSLMRSLENKGGRLYMYPAAEYDALFGEWERRHIDGIYSMSAERQAYDIHLSHIEPELEMIFCDTVRLYFGKEECSISHIQNAYGRTIRYTKTACPERARILMDSSSLEIFLGDGEKVISSRFYPKAYKSIDFRGKVELYAGKYIAVQA